MKVELVPIERVIPYARNPRHNEAGVAKVAASIKEFGWQQPIVVDAGMTVVVGHTRLAAARVLGHSEVPVHIARHLSPAQVKAYRLADNRLHEEAEWDHELLALELGELRNAGMDLALTGFDEDELAGLMLEETAGLTDPDDVPEPQAEAVSRPGEVWLLGRHRLACGDSTDAAAVARALAGVKPHLMVTDPPYGVEYDPAWRHRAGVNTSKRTGKVENDDRADWRAAWALFPGEVAYVWHAGLYATTVAESLEARGFQIRAQIIWAKDRLVMGRGHYHWQHEPCWYAARGTAQWSGDRTQTTLWPIASRAQDAETVHGTQKPVECMRRPILNNSSPGQAVYEPFCGSGTTIIAAEVTGRACIAMELSPIYVDVAIRRWQAFTGLEAMLEGERRSFATIASERLQPAAAA